MASNGHAHSSLGHSSRTPLEADSGGDALARVPSRKPSGLDFTVPRDIASDAASSTTSGLDGQSTPASSIASPRSLLDAYAPRYVPMWQRRANAILAMSGLPRFADHSAPRKALDGLATELYPYQLLGTLVTEGGEVAVGVQKQLAKPLTSKVPATAAAIPATPLRSPQADSPYDVLWHCTLRLEHHAMRKLLDEACLYVRPLRYQPTEGDGAIYILSAPFIRENWPPVDVGDPVILIQVDTIEQRAVPAIFDAHVHSVRRVAGQLWLRCDALLMHQAPIDPILFNVIFLPQDRLYLNAHRAVEFLSRRLKVSSNRIPSGWLFPRWDHLPAAVPPLPPSDSISWVDDQLNDEQREAVISVTYSKRLIPTLISGPPGTGKTKTIVEMTHQIIRAHPKAHLLVCAASGPSADTVAQRLAVTLSPTQLLRLNDVSRTFEEVPSSLLSWCHVVENRFEVPKLSTLLSKRVIVCTCDEAALLMHAHCTNDALARLAHLVLGALHNGVDHGDLLGPHFSHLLVDEAAQAHEPQLAVPLAVVTPAVGLPGVDDRPPQVCLCGDTKQLGPNIVSDEARANELDTSMLERLFRRAVYAGHPDTRENRLARRRGRSRAQWDDQGGRDKPFVELVRNYRSHPCILMLPSSLSYADSLIACAVLPRGEASPSNWKRLPRSDFPLLFVGTDTPDLFVDDGVSWFNDGEQSVVVQLVTDLVRSGAGNVRPSEISVITPFREQVWRIRLALRAIGLSDVDVGNVESLQGKENRVVFLSTVRASTKRIEADQRANRGVLFQPRRANVALTRAKELLVIVGNVAALAVDPDWRAYLAFCRRNGVYEGVAPPAREDDDAALTAHVSYMEEALHHAHDGGVKGDAELSSRLLTGGVVNAVLKGV